MCEQDDVGFREQRHVGLGFYDRSHRIGIDMQPLKLKVDTGMLDVVNDYGLSPGVWKVSLSWAAITAVVVVSPRPTSNVRNRFFI